MNVRSWLGGSTSPVAIVDDLRQIPAGRRMTAGKTLEVSTSRREQRRLSLEVWLLCWKCHPLELLQVGSLVSYPPTSQSSSQQPATRLRPVQMGSLGASPHSTILSRHFFYLFATCRTSDSLQYK